jgi:hypothetical protein
MAKASTSVSTPEIHGNPAISAADAVLALINSRCRDEIAAIFAKAMPAPDVGASTALRAAYLASDWHRALRAYLEERGRTNTEEEVDALDERLDDSMNAILAKPVRTFDDLVVRAAIAMNVRRDEIANPEHQDPVIAAVVRGILDLAGLKFDAEGRLLGEEPAAA